MDSLCGRCQESVHDGVMCNSCAQSFHFVCGGITEQGYRKLGDRKSQWRCSTCKPSNKATGKTTAAAAAASPSSLTPQRSLTLESVMQELDKINLKLLPLESLAADVDLIKKDIVQFKVVAESFTEKIKLIEEKVQVVENFKDELSSLKSRVGALEEEMHTKEQWLRTNNVEIKGVPQKATENLFDIVGKIGNLVMYPVAKQNINFVTRIPSRGRASNAKSILVSFINKYTKEDFVAAARQKSFTPADIGLQGSHKIYVNDHLTTRNKQLLTKAKALARENNIQYVWVKHAKIFTRKNSTSPVLTITKESDLEKIGANLNNSGLDLN